MSSNTGVLEGLASSLLLKVLLAAPVLYALSCMIYNVFFHPLRNFPGPKIAAATPLLRSFYVLTGHQDHQDKYLHERYGEVVRVRPNELSFITPHAWSDIFMHRQGQPQMEKVRREHFLPHADTFNISNAPDDIHTRQRRAVSHAFSDKALRDQEPLIKKYVDLLMDFMREQQQKDEPLDMVNALNFTTFDIIGDLAFGESFKALETRQNHPWIESFFQNLVPGSLISETFRLPGGLTLFNLTLRPTVIKMMKMADFARDKIQERLERGAGDRPDLMSFVLKNNQEGKGMSQREIIDTFNIFIIAGSETTASLLSGTTYLLQKNPRVLEELNAEIRGEFSDEKEINLSSTRQLPYLHAVIEESLRMYPPAPQGLERWTPPSGTTIAGYHVPGHTVVGVPPAVAFRSPVNFVDPLEFIPERWIEPESSRFKNDKRDVVKPFSAGPRNCIGQNLAYSEMKLILARVVFNFDLELVDKKDDWMDQTAYSLWIKKPLMVKIKPAARK